MTDSPEIWPPAALPKPDITVMPGWATTIGRGMAGRCPCCGGSPIFDGYLKVRAECSLCHAPLGDMPSDDTPPYVAMLVILHVIAFLVVVVLHNNWQPNLADYAGMVALLLAVCMVALRVAKGAIIGVLLKLGMRRPVLN